jgi:hypothetical protein
MSNLSTQDVYVDGKLVVPKRFKKSKVLAEGREWSGSWEQACYLSHYQLNKDHLKRQAKENYYRNHAIRLNTAKEYRELNQDKVKAVIKRWHKQNAEKSAKSKKDYRKENLARLTLCRREYHVKRLESDPFYRLSRAIRSLTRYAFKRSTFSSTKDSKTENLLGCSISELCAYIEHKFTDGMSWSNRGVGGWDVDHVIPLKAAADLCGGDVVVYQRMISLLSHHTNLQPLWFKDNKVKLDRYDTSEALAYLNGRMAECHQLPRQ